MTVYSNRKLLSNDSLCSLRHYSRREFICPLVLSGRWTLALMDAEARAMSIVEGTVDTD